MQEFAVKRGQIRRFKSHSTLKIIRESSLFLVLDVQPSLSQDREPFFWVDYLLPTGEIVKSYPGDYIMNHSEVISE